MNNYDDYCTKLFGEHSCTKEDCPNCPSAQIIAEHDSDLLDKVADRIHKKMCSENCGERQCVDSMDRCVWYWYVTEVIAEMKAEVSQ